MARNRVEVDRDEKIEAILERAEDRLRDGGYDGMSIAAIARDLAIAQNSIYWYFPSKDDLLVGVMQRLFQRAFANKPPASEGPAAQILWVVDRLAELEPQRGALRERARVSETAAAFERESSARLHEILLNALRPHVAPEQLDDAAEAFVSAVQGTLARGIPAAQRRRVLSFALARLAGLDAQT